jgi:hypothetical protein
VKAKAGSFAATLAVGAQIECHCPIATLCQKYHALQDTFTIAAHTVK